MKAIIYKYFKRSVYLLVNFINRSLSVFFGVNYYVNKKAIEDSAEYAYSNFTETINFPSREKLWDYCLKENSALKNENRTEIDMLIAEFGVWRGESINYFAKKSPDARLFGFDSFLGLEENWYQSTVMKNSFSTSGKLPKCKKNVELFKGWFTETVPTFVTRLQGQQISILHMDADTYEPTIFVLNQLRDNLRKDSIVIFDEYFGYPNWRQHEFKAWNSFVNSFGINYKYIGYTNAQVAIKIL